MFASDARYAREIQATVGADIEVVMAEGALEGRKVTTLAELLATQATPRRRDGEAGDRPETITKFLFTSGSTKLPKAVVNTHGCGAPPQQMRQSMRF